jgi:hypothetical protein
MKRFLITVYTNWCGEDNTYAAWAESEFDNDLEMTAVDLAYNNFCEFGGSDAILHDLFPETTEYTEEQYDEAANCETEYYGHTIEEWDELRPEEEWDWYELVYDRRTTE